MQEEATKPSPRRDFGGTGRFGLLCCLVYAAASWLLGQSERVAAVTYPFNTFSMYAHSRSGVARHLLLRDERGAAHRIDSFEAFQCDRPLELDDARCPASGSLVYLDDDLMQYIREHQGVGTTGMQLVRRTWMISPGSPPSFEGDCVMMSCRVSP